MPRDHDVRLSPLAASARQTILDIYEDLAKNAPVAGLVFPDETAPSDVVNVSPAVLSVYRAMGGPLTLRPLMRAEPQAHHLGGQRYGEFLNHFILELTARFRLYQPAILTVRTLSAPPALDSATAWFAQSVAALLQEYDFVAIPAVPLREPPSSSARWLQQLVDAVAATPGALYRTVFVLPSVDWRTHRPLPSTRLAAQLRVLHRQGARNFGYAPDDFRHDHPAFAVIMPAISLATNPGRYP
jgi:biofilm PGA synthesis lipoprotein PgaB